MDQISLLRTFRLDALTSSLQCEASPVGFLVFVVHGCFLGCSVSRGQQGWRCCVQQLGGTLQAYAWMEILVLLLPCGPRIMYRPSGRDARGGSDSPMQGGLFSLHFVRVLAIQQFPHPLLLYPVYSLGKSLNGMSVFLISLSGPPKVTLSCCNLFSSSCGSHWVSSTQGQPSGACMRTSGSFVVECGLSGRMSHRYRLVYDPFSMLQLRFHSCFLSLMDAACQLLLFRMFSPLLVNLRCGWFIFSAWSKSVVLLFPVCTMEHASWCSQGGMHSHSLLVIFYALCDGRIRPSFFGSMMLGAVRARAYEGLILVFSALMPMRLFV